MKPKLGSHFLCDHLERGWVVFWWRMISSVCTASSKYYFPLRRKTFTFQLVIHIKAMAKGRYLVSFKLPSVMWPCKFKSNLSFILCYCLKHYKKKDVEQRHINESAFSGYSMGALQQMKARAKAKTSGMLQTFQCTVTLYA